jgi:hypothetical protein
MATEYRKVRLLKPHTHAGTKHEAGEEIELTKEQAEWLYSTYVAERTKAKQHYDAFIGDESTNSDEDKIDD